MENNKMEMKDEEITFEVVEAGSDDRVYTKETVIKLCEIAYIAGAKTHDNQGWDEQISDMESAFNNVYEPIHSTWICQDDISMSDDEKKYITSFANRVLDEGINENVFIFK